MLPRASRPLLTALGLAAALGACSGGDGYEEQRDSAVVEFAPEPAVQPVAPEPEAAPAPTAEATDESALPDGPIPYDQLQGEKAANAPTPQKSDENLFY